MTANDPKVKVSDDGVWVTFRSSYGNEATVSIEKLSQQLGPIAREVLRDWAMDQIVARKELRGSLHPEAVGL